MMLNVYIPRSYDNKPIRFDEIFKKLEEAKNILNNVSFKETVSIQKH